MAVEEKDIPACEVLVADVVRRQRVDRRMIVFWGNIREQERRGTLDSLRQAPSLRVGKVDGIVGIHSVANAHRVCADQLFMGASRTRIKRQAVVTEAIKVRTV